MLKNDPLSHLDISVKQRKHQEKFGYWSEVDRSYLGNIILWKYVFTRRYDDSKDMPPGVYMLSGDYRIHEVGTVLYRVSDSDGCPPFYSYRSYSISDAYDMFYSRKDCLCPKCMDRSGDDGDE